MTNVGERAMRAMTPSEMHEQLLEAARLSEVCLRSYLEFPTADSFDGMVIRLREYQTAWMHVAARAKAREDAP